jgi:hypothetical protein
MLHGQVIRKWQPEYIMVFYNNSRQNGYKIQGIWDYAVNRNANRFSSMQVVTNNLNTDNFNRGFRRHRIRGHGNVFQFKITSIDGLPFDISGWAILETSNVSV